MKASYRRLAVLLALCLAPVSAADAELMLLGQFDAEGVGVLVSVGFDSVTDTVWAYRAGGSLRTYSRAGTPVWSVARPGEAGDDADIDFAPEAFSLGGTPIAAGTLLFTNGESGTADIYAVNPATGTVIASLVTTFGLSHVVGGSYHPHRKTLFLVQDRVPPGTADDSRVAEIDPADGSVLSTFQISSPFTIFYGDIEVSAATGNLFVVSSDESSIRELTPTGSLVRDWALPAGVGNLSGIALDDARGELWVSGTGGTIWRLGGLPSAQLPTLTLSLNQTVFQPGDTMIVTATVTPGNPPVLVNAFIVVQAPDGQFFSLQADGTVVPGISPVVTGFVPIPFHGPIIEYAWTGSEPQGSWSWLSALTTQAGALIGPFDQDPFVFGGPYP